MAIYLDVFKELTNPNTGHSNSSTNYGSLNCWRYTDTLTIRHASKVSELPVPGITHVYFHYVTIHSTPQRDVVSKGAVAFIAQMISR